MDGSVWAEECRRAQGALREWARRQAGDATAMHALANHARRRSLLDTQEPHELSPYLAAMHGAMPSLRAKHTQAIESLIAALKRAVTRLDVLHAELAAVHASLFERYARCAPDERTRPARVIVGAGRGIAAQELLMPPAEQCLSWIAELDRLLAHELLEKHELLEGVTHGAAADELRRAAERWAEVPRARAVAVERLDLLVDALSL